MTSIKKTVNATIIEVGSDDISSHPRVILEFPKDGRLDLPISPDQARLLGTHLYKTLTLTLTIETPA